MLCVPVSLLKCLFELQHNPEINVRIRTLVLSIAEYAAGGLNPRLYAFRVYAIEVVALTFSDLEQTFHHIICTVALT